VADPFLIRGPALISFSGGRTSAYMLWRILQACGGLLPDDVHVCFANTGKEREETLRFVHECASRWSVRVRWLEWRVSDSGFEEVGFNSASRQGEPFSALIAKRGFLPNAVTRFCTTALKIQTMGKFMQSLGHDRWSNVVGLRHDEGLRCLKAYARNAAGKEKWTTFLPLDKALITKRDVRTFWWGAPEATFENRAEPQGFDLGLRDYEGNCDICFLKSEGIKRRLMREHPTMPDWWIAEERSLARRTRSGASARFVTEYTYAQLAAEVERQPALIDDSHMSDEHDAECGLQCAVDTDG